MNILHICWALILLVATNIVAAQIKTGNFDSIDYIKRQELSSEALTQQSIDIINALDRNGPQLNAVVEINPDALAIAAQMDRTAKQSPLHGIPVLIKDNIDTADKMQTSAGSLALLGAPAIKDAVIVSKLRAAGMVVLGKTNLSEWANFRSRQSISGWSARAGQTKNPHVLDRSPCGSSSGSAVAVAAGMAPLAVGTETDGSILCPAAMTGIVGMKPSRGLVSQSGIIPLSHNQDTAGPMARTVTDAALLLQVLAGSGPNDPLTVVADQHVSDYSQHLNRNYLHGKRIGVLTDQSGQHPATHRIFKQAVTSAESAGAVLIKNLSLPNIDQVYEPEYQVFLYDFKHGINQYLKNRPGIEVRNLTQLIAFNEKHKDRQMPYFGQDIFIEAAQKGDLNTPEYTRSLEQSRYHAGQAGINALMQKHQLDALVAVAYSPAFLIDPVFGDNFGFGNSTAAAVAGNPSITVPAGFVHALPVGIVLIGKYWQDAELIGMAYAFEQAHGAWQAPRFLPTIAP